jgi:hypothetical protein
MPPLQAVNTFAVGVFRLPGGLGNLDVRGQRAETKTVGLAVEFIVVVLLPTALGFGALGAVRVLRWAGQWRSRPVVVEPIERLTARLRRLRVQLEDLETRPDVAHKGLRLRALRAAYVDCLIMACARLEVRPPSGSRGGPPRGPADRVPQAEIYRVEAALRERGLDVRETASH